MQTLAARSPMIWIYSGKNIRPKNCVRTHLSYRIRCPSQVNSPTNGSNSNTIGQLDIGDAGNERRYIY